MTIDAVMEVAGRDYIQPGVRAMLGRGREFPSPTAALLAGIGVQPEGRRLLDQRVEDMWCQPWVPNSDVYDEVVIGAGPHGLIYAAVRAAQGVSVVVLDRGRAGGAFACSNGPSFWLNSRNRPGPGGLPGEGIGLNVLPGCPLQPSMIGGSEYQTNDQLAWVVRANFAALGIEVHTGVNVTGIDDTDDYYLISASQYGVNLDGGIAAARVILATGLGEPTPFVRDPAKPPDRVLSFGQFMSKMDDPFPLRSMNRVAVLGAGDSGKTAIEALLGQGPTTGWSVPELDWPTTIDWYGCKYANQQQWCGGNRGRYAGIGKALGTRVTPRTKSAYYPMKGFESVGLGPRNYDWIINCLGFKASTFAAGLGDFAPYSPVKEGRSVARRAGDTEVYRVGPAANLPFSAKDTETVPALRAIGENTVSLFRYAPMTATLAATLPLVLV